MYVPDAVVHHVGSGTTGGQHSDFPFITVIAIWCSITPTQRATWASSPGVLR
jgi:hypothetical protein